jgi:hypothetical protein
MDFKKLTSEVMNALASSKEVTQVDSSDAEPVFESDTKSTFTMNSFHEVKTGKGRERKPLGEWEVKVTLEMTYKKYVDE